MILDFNIVGFLMIAIIFVVFTGILMKIANRIGEKIGFAKMLQDLWGKIKRSN